MIVQARNAPPPGTRGDQRLQRGTDLFEMLDLSFDFAAFGDGLHPHVGAISLRVGFEREQLGDFPK
jgi:hypothetical protein